MRHVDGEEQLESLRLRWTQVGEVTIDSSGKLAFPKVTNAPGLYKFCVADAGSVKKIYIGESDNLSRRFTHYRNPGPTQQTNIRMNNLLSNCLKGGAEVTVLAVVNDCWIGTGPYEKQVDLASKLTRRMFEHFAAAMHPDNDVELLNL